MLTFQTVSIATHASRCLCVDRPATRLARRFSLFMLVLLTGCTGVPQGVVPVSHFELDRYLGKWYEIARLDHSFERGLERVTAEYSLQDDGSVRVVNRGYSLADGQWREIVGKARFVGKPDIAHLKVSFFGPFYSSYVVFELDPVFDQTGADRNGTDSTGSDSLVDYQHAFVSGNSKSYLWLLSRTPSVSDGLLKRFRARASELGFPVEELVMVVQGRGSD